MHDPSIEVVLLPVVLFDLPPDFASLDPLNVVLHVAVNVESRICDGLNSHFDVALLNVHHRLFDSLSHLELVHDDG